MRAMRKTQQKSSCACLRTNNESKKQFKVVHQQAFAYLRRKLCDGLFNKTTGMKHKTVPTLLRLLHVTWNDNSAIDRARLRHEMEACMQMSCCPTPLSRLSSKNVLNQILKTVSRSEIHSAQEQRPI